jgi:hypothetical protein
MNIIRRTLDIDAIAGPDISEDRRRLDAYNKPAWPYRWTT